MYLTGSSLYFTSLGMARSGITTILFFVTAGECAYVPIVTKQLHIKHACQLVAWGARYRRIVSVRDHEATAKLSVHEVMTCSSNKCSTAACLLSAHGQNMRRTSAYIPDMHIYIGSEPTSTKVAALQRSSHRHAPSLSHVHNHNLRISLARDVGMYNGMSGV